MTGATMPATRALPTRPADTHGPTGASTPTSPAKTTTAPWATSGARPGYESVTPGGRDARSPCTLASHTHEDSVTGPGPGRVRSVGREPPPDFTRALRRLFTALLTDGGSSWCNRPGRTMKRTLAATVATAA